MLEDENQSVHIRFLFQWFDEVMVHMAFEIRMLYAPAIELKF